MKNKHLPIMIGLIVLIVVVVAAAAIVGSKSKKDNSMDHMNMPGHSSNTSKTSDSTNGSTNNSSNPPANGGSSTNSGSSDSTAANKVEIKNYTFSPTSITVKVGTTVTWTNTDSVHHTVTADESEGPKSEPFGKGETYSYKFTKAGTFTYHCEPHPYMHGTVVVTE